MPQCAFCERELLISDYGCCGNCYSDRSDDNDEYACSYSCNATDCLVHREAAEDGKGADYEDPLGW